ncbi:anaerobic benzoate catabolism transcriptional regulator [Limihaloglobus sulfuriphilus]|uniref:Anaerobic benzoate catabolism transcriptional regulator n=1 Tax=Limihaloglobus sulfuriphilus TaxID=1851148 RepID=A0A1Q2MHD3_9BACT|nr:helix-turn-helix transcriptional regulator [Limihaloglobus sulfuriphilus]AQQ72100.1 anaerobic benzoate catabolism transcriptional regulator [Limihaloglobus sulfuriphilus]
MESNILKTFGKNVRELRLSKGWSQEELARRCDLHRTYIGSIERHERNVSLINVELIAKALDVKICNLVED